MSTIPTLRNIGLTDGEIKVYEALLDLGECTKTRLATTSGVSPANLYDITERLSRKGLISVVERNGVKHFAPAHPRNLFDYLDQKRKEIDGEQLLVTKILPALNARYDAAESGTTVEVFTGWGGLKTVFLDLIDACEQGDVCRVYGASKGHAGDVADRFFLKYGTLRADKGIRTQIIFNEDLKKRRARISFFLRNPTCDVRFLKQETNTEVMIYHDVTVMLILTATPMAIRIRERGVADSFRSHFDLLWRHASG